MIIKAYKKEAESMRQAVARLEIPTREKLTFSGRLDPMASGLFLILTGEDRFKKDEFNKLDKEYYAEILFGVKTDSADILGIINASKDCQTDKSAIKKAGLKFKGSVNWKYPCFSSKKFKGKSLFEHALFGNCPEERPKYKAFLYKVKLLDTKSVSSKLLQKGIKERISKLKESDIDFKYKDYRKDEILKSWDRFFKDKKQDFIIASFNLKVSHSFYVRDFAERLGEELDCPALAFKIVRLSIGKSVKIPFINKYFYKKLYNI